MVLIKSLLHLCFSPCWLHYTRNMTIIGCQMRFEIGESEKREWITAAGNTIVWHGDDIA